MLSAIAHPRKPHLRHIRPRTRLLVVSLIAVAVQVVLHLPVWDWDERAPEVATAVGIAVAVAAGVFGGVVPAAIAATAGWFLNFLFVADESWSAFIALPFWLLAAAAAGWLAARLRDGARRRRLAESRLEAIQDAAGDAVLRIDSDGVIAVWSPAAREMYGYGSGEIVGRPLAELFAGPDAEEQAARVLDGEPHFGELLEQQRRDGVAFTASVTVTPDRDEPGNPGHAMFVARDIGELRRIRDDLGNTGARYRSLTEHLPVVTYVRSFDGDRETTFVSPQIDRLLGYTPDEWLEDPDLFLRLVHPDDREEVAAREEVDAANGSRSTFRMVARDGRVVWVRDEAVAVLDESGRPLCVQGYLQDVSERKGAEQERSELRAAHSATAEEARGRQRRIDFVAEAASILSSSLDARSTIQRVAALATRELSEWCVVDVLHDEGTVSRLVAEGAESASSVEPEVRPEPKVAELIRRGRHELSQSQIRLP
ncbi:MAG TPA: PAS domain S-box protein, partial [Candidatus Limnocylindrales bacterium]|nr:PAS domain S-box protein [Candidatus Limnocylindrales bacterium]